MIRENTFKFSQFSPRQLTVLTWWHKDSGYADYDGIIADGAVRSGKTVSMSLSYVIWAMNTFENRNLAICGVTQNSIYRNVIKDLKTMLPECGYTCEHKRSEYMLRVRWRGRVNDFYLFSGRDERSQDAIAGITLAGALFDEAALMPQSFVQQVMLRCSIDGAKHWFNCNPAGSDQHWFKQTIINKYKVMNYLYLHFTMEDNLSLSEEVKERYKRQYVGVYYRRYIEGRWVAAEGVIYDMWDNTLNTYTEGYVSGAEMAAMPRYIGVDYGTTNPMVFLDCYDAGNELLIENEYYFDSKRTLERTQKTDKEYADDFEKFVEYDHGVTVVIDPSAASFIAELRGRGYRIKKADNEVLDGIRVTMTMIQTRHLKVKQGTTPNLIREMGLYIWDDKAALRGEEKPLKINDHCLTGDTVVNTVNGDIAIRDLVGKLGLVYSFDGNRKVIKPFTDVRQTGTEDIYEIELEDGKTVKCSGEHPILTKRGWIRAEQLTELDEVLEIQV